jgi:hypothetical protein
VGPLHQGTPRRNTKEHQGFSVLQCLNSVHLALNSGVLPRSGKFKGADFRRGLWDHQAFVLNYLPPGTVFVNLTLPELTADLTLGLTVYGGVDVSVEDAIAEARRDNPSAGFIGIYTVSNLNQAQVDAVLDGTWNENDPTGGTTLVSYMFDLGR